MMSEIPNTFWDPLLEAGRITIGREHREQPHQKQDDIDEMKSIIKKMQTVIDKQQEEKLK